MELNYYIQENNRMRNRLKEFTKTEIELCDQIELLTEENRLKSQKISAMNLMNRYGDMATPEDVQKKIKKECQKYEKEIEKLTEKVLLLERRNRDLEEVRKILNASYNSLDANSQVIDK